MQPGELIRAVRIPLPLAPLAAFHKIAKRRFDDISSVAVGFALDVEDGVVRRARIGLGGVAATPIRARQTEEALTGEPWTRGHGPARRRRSWPRREHRSTITEPARRTARRCWARPSSSCTPSSPRPGTRPHRRSEHERAVRTTHESRRRASASRTKAPRCTSRARPSTPTTWSCAPRTCCTPTPSRRPTPTPGSPGCAPSPAYDVPGVVRVLTAADVPGINDAGVKHDEPLFPDEVDVPRPRVCWVLADTIEAARLGAAAVEVDYEPLPALVTIAEAIAARSFQGAQPHMERGDVEAGLAGVGPRVQRRVRVRRPGALLPGDPLRARPRRRGRAGLRAEQHPAPVGDAGDRRARPRPGPATR